MAKRLFFIISAVFLVAVVSSLAFADTKEKDSMTGKGMMAGKGMMDDNQMMGMCGMMSHMMMCKSMISTSDGGVIVMAGNKLQKYDKDLNLKKEVEIKIDMEGMQKMMGQMMQGQGSMMQQPQEESKEQVPSRHEEHH